MDRMTTQERSFVFVIPPTGTYCREDRCQSFFDPKLIPTMRAPLEECEAAGAVTAGGGTATVLDAPALNLSWSTTIRLINQRSPDWIVVTASFGTLESDLIFCEELRRTAPASRIGLRGAPCYTQAEEILNRSAAIDFCMRGDYELVVADLLSFGLSGARGVVFRSNDAGFTYGERAYTADLDSLPSPDRSTIQSNRYRVRFVGATQATVRVQRGCPFSCSYCLVHTVSGDRARHRSAQSIAEEIKELSAQGIKYFYLRADTFSLNKSWTFKLCELLTQRCPGIRWVTTTRVECIDDDIARAMRKAGCYGISFGIDVGDPIIAEKVNKPFDPIRARRAIEVCNSHQIISLAYLMIGFTWDTPETLQQSVLFVKDLGADLITVHYAHPYPGTKYFDDVKGSRDTLRKPFAQAKPAHEIGALSKEQIERWGRRMLATHYLRPRPWISIAKKALAFWKPSSKITRKYSPEKQPGEDNPSPLPT